MYPTRLPVSVDAVKSTPGAMRSRRAVARSDSRQVSHALGNSASLAVSLPSANAGMSPML